jgi:hypothetical protein
MERKMLTTLTAALSFVLAGCMSGPLHENPVLIGADLPEVTNPVYVPLGPHSYGLVFEKVLDVVSDYFDIAYSNRYDGRVETFPSAAPGLGQFWRPGSPDFYQRLYATLQSVRHRAIVLIQPAEDGGYFIDVRVFKELEDVPAPSRATAGPAIFRADNVANRDVEIFGEGIFNAAWVPIGRDHKLEQVILSRLARFDLVKAAKKSVN